MSYPVSRSPQAEEDVLQIASYLAQRSPRTAQRFLEATDRAYARLADFPEIGGRFESTTVAVPELRVWPIPKFGKYLLFYRFTGTEVRIYRIIYGARDLESLLSP